MGSSKKQTIGYRYFMGLQFGLSLGPVDALLAIRGGDRDAWVGTVTQSERITINAPDLWGGEKKEGGIAGELDVMMGEPDQQPNDYLVSQLGEPMPAFRGMLSLVFRKGMVGAMNPYPKPWKFKVERFLKGWHGGEAWYPEKVKVPLLDGTVTMLGPGWEYQLETFSEPNTVWSDFTPPTDGWLQGGEMPFTSPGLGGGEYWSSDRTNIWLRRKMYVQASGLTLNIAAENGCAVWINGNFVGSNNPTNAPIPNNQNNPVSYELSAVGELDVLVKAYAEVNASDDGGNTVVLSFTGTPVHGMNPAHIAYEALTNPEWGLGYPPAVIDDASFRAAADVFFSEGLGLCGQWARQDTIDGFIQEVMNHAGAVLAQDPRTGLFRLLPIRGGYDVETLPEFRRGLNVLAVESFERAAITETTNEVTVEYTDMNTGKKGSVTVQHLANIQAQGGVSSQSVRYPLIPTSGLAQRLAARDLAAKSLPLCRVRLRVDRSGYGILPGEVVRWSDSNLGIEDMPMRVLEVDYGNLTAGAIRLTLAEDVFGMPATTYLGQQGSGWEEPPKNPQPSPQVAAFEIPYVAIHRAEGASAAAAVAPSSGFLGMVAAKPPGLTYGFTLYAAADGGQLEETGTGEWSAGGLLAQPIGRQDTDLELAGTYNLAALEPGDLAMLGDGPEAELVRIDAVDVPGAAVAVGRGVGDTVPRPWPVGTRLWGIEDGAAFGVTEYTDGESVDARAATVASGGELPLSSAPGDVVEIAARAARPYPPGLFRINGQADPAAAFGPTLTLTWAHRDRLLQADQLVDQEQASIGPEPGTTYTVRWSINGVPDGEEVGITDTTAEIEPSASGLLYVEVVAVRDGLESWHAQARELGFSVSPNGRRVTTSGDVRVTAGGDTRISKG